LKCPPGGTCVQVQHFYGSVHTIGAPLGPSTGVVVCTIEKANIL